MKVRIYEIYETTVEIETDNINMSNESRGTRLKDKARSLCYFKKNKLHRKDAILKSMLTFTEEDGEQTIIINKKI